ncbi:MAG: hypothetical protein KC613_24165 [Myxococcales bacterium]|nr:hypothetical protein [Myxococcales bacterium]MCB9524948.1 hypothetical protein [Myxococcales bacterium]
MSAGASVLDQRPVFRGAGPSVQAYDALLRDERARQADQVATLDKLRQRNVAIQGALADEMAALKGLSNQVRGGEQAEEAGFFGWLKRTFGVGEPAQASAPSVEALLRQQYEVSQARLAEAAAFADRLAAAESDLFDEVDRLNGKLVEAADNQALAAAHLLAVEGHRDALKARLREPAVQGDPTARRRLEAELDRCRRAQAESATALKLYDTAGERLERLKANTVRLAETVAHLRSDIGRYVHAAGERLDLVAGQIDAVGVAADATVVMLELEKALEGMSSTLNEATRFVSKTQRYFREHIDGLIADLDVYDDETRRVLDENLAFADAADELQVEAAVREAKRRL